MSRALGILQGRLGRVALLDMDASLVTHAHRGCHVLLKVGGADTFFDVRGEMCPLTDRSAVLVNAWEPHAYNHQAHAPQTHILALYIEPEWLGEMDRQFGCAGHARFFPHSCVSISREIRERAQSLGQQMLASDPASQEAGEALVFDLMKEVISGFADHKSLRLAPEISWMADFRIRRAVRLMHERLHLSFDAADIARAAGLSRPHFFSRFRAVTGLTPALFFNTLRMEAATRKLVSGAAAMADVGRELGFDAPANFTRFFRQQQGVAPSEYRRVAHYVG